MEKITVSAEPLRQILQALIGPDHYIRELQYTKDPVEAFPNNPINILVKEYNSAVEWEKGKS